MRSIEPVIAADTDTPRETLRHCAQAMLRAAAAQDFDTAQAELQRLFRWRGRFPTYALFCDIAAGRQRIHDAGGLFVLGDEPMSARMRENFDAALEHCADFLQRTPPVILLHRASQLRDMHLSIECFPGLAVLRLSMQTPGYPDDLRAIQFHETAHCFLTCGLRLLDEGLAHYVAARWAGAELPPTDPDRLPSPQAMLSRSADAMFGERADSDRGVYLAACRYGTELVEAIAARAGGPGLVALFERLAGAANDAEIVALVEAASGRTIPAAAPVQTRATPAQTPLLESARRRMFAAWETKQASDLDPAIAELEAADALQHGALLDALIGLKIHRLMLLHTAGSAVPAEDLAEVDALLKVGESLPAGRLWLLRGCRAMVAIAIARPNLIKVAVAGQEAFTAFRNADALIPDDPELLIQYGVLLLNAPEKHGGDRDRGAAKLRRAAENPIWRRHAERVLAKHGVVAEAAPEAAFPQGPRTALDPDAPVVLRVHDVKLKLGGFLLRPNDFEVKRGERIGLIGRNGSGKTVLLDLLLGLRKPDSGVVRLGLGNGVPGDLSLRRQIGGLLQGADLPGASRVSEIMALHLTMYGHSDPTVTRALGLSELAEKFWRELSRGQKQRVLLWLALAHLPDLALLDEPTLGLDEWHARALRTLLDSLPISLVLVSHNASDLIGTHRVLCLRDGLVVDEGPLPELLARHVGRYKGRILQPLPTPAVTELQNLPGLVRSPESTETGWTVYGAQHFDQSFRAFIGRHGVTAFSLEPASVEDFLARVAKE